MYEVTERTARVGVVLLRGKVVSLLNVLKQGNVPNPKLITVKYSWNNRNDSERHIFSFSSLERTSCISR